MKLVEESLWRLKIDGKPAINELAELEQKLADAKKAQDGLQRGTKEYKQSQADIKQLNAEIEEMRKTMGAAGMTVRQLEGYSKQLNKEIKDLTPGTEAYIKKSEELKDVNTRLANVKKDVRGVADEVDKSKSSWDNLKDWVTGALAAFSIVEVIQAVVNFTKESLLMASSVSDAFSDIQKATGMTAKEVEDLNAEIGKIDTRTAQESLLDIAKVGGAIGVANEELLGFVKSTDMAVVALGDEFSGGAEEVASVMGTLSKLFKETKDLEAGDAISQIGSAINELGAAGTATGPVVAEFATRMGQLGDLSPQISQTLGLGAAFQELGLSAEISAGGLSNILLGAAKATELFAQHLGMTEAEFKKLINTNPNEVILKLAESFKGLPIDVVVKRLDDLGIKSQEATKVMSLLSTQTDAVREKQQLAATAMAENTSLTNEFAIKNTNAAAILEKTKKEVAAISLTLGQALLPALVNVATGFIALLKVVGAAPGFIRENKEMFIALGAAVLAFNGHLIVATASSLAHAAAEKARLIWTESATIAQWAMNVALTANPIGAVVAAVALLVGGLVTWYNNSETLRGALKGLWEGLKAGIEIAGDVLGFIGDGFQQLIDKMPWLTDAIDYVGDVVDTVFSAMGDVVDWFGDKIDLVVDWFDLLYDKVLGVGQSIGQAMQPGFDFISNGFNTLKGGINEFFDWVGAGVSKVAGFLKSITPDGFLEAGRTFSDAGKKISKAFNDAFETEQTAGHAKQSAADKQHLDSKATNQKATATAIADHDTQTHVNTIEKNSAASEKKRQREEEKEKKHAEKVAAEKLKQEQEAQKAIEDARIAAIKNDEEREIATLGLKATREQARINESKVSQEVKAAWEKALVEKLEHDIEVVQKKYRDKKLEEDKKRIDETRKLEEQQRLEREEREFTTQKTILERQLANEKLSIAERQVLKLQLIDLEHERELARIEDVATKERQKAKETSDQLKKLAGDDAEKKKQIDTDYAAASKAIDDKLLAEKAAANASHQAEKKEVERKTLEERRANQEGFFSALKALMNGDFSTFTDYLTKKLGNERAMNDERLQNWTGKTNEILNIVGQAIQTMSDLNDKYLEMQITRNNKERDDKVLKLQQQYKKGLIDKDTYEKGINSINQQADAKEKELKMKAWKRDQAMQIAMAVINGAMAALKSLATMGWPLGLVGVAASAVITGVNIAMIKAQKPPSFAKGGTIRNAGVPEGPLHGSTYGKGGIGLVRRDTGEEVGEMEGGEPIMILSRNTYRNNRKVIDKLMHSSLHRNGAPVFAREGAIFGEGGTYGDMLRRYDEGGYYNQGDYSESKNMNNGWGDNNSGSSQYDSPYEQEPDYGDMGYSDWDGSYDDGTSGTGDAYTTTQLTTAEIQKSQALMERIGKNTNDTANFTEKTMRAVLDLNSKMDQAIGVLNGINGAANRTADNAGNAANAGWAAAGASNRAADAIAMAAANDL